MTGSENNALLYFSKAILREGCDNRMGMSKMDKNRKPRGYWTKETCLKEIQERYERGEKLNPAAVNKEQGSLYVKTLQLVGNWGDALELCGIDYDSVTNKKPNGYWTKDKVAVKIKEIIKEDNDLSAANMVENYSEVYRGAVKAYGSWRQALSENHIKYEEHIRKRPNNYWSKNKVDGELDKIIDEGHDLTITYINNSKRGFYKGVVKYYGSWEKALESRGIPYDSIRKDHGSPPYYGQIFEKIVYGVLEDLSVEYIKKPHLENGTIPDIKFSNGKIYDIKLSNYTDWHGINTLKKYGKYSDGVGIIFLRGDYEQVTYEVGKVKFKHISYFTNKLPDIKREEYENRLRKLVSDADEGRTII